MSETPITIDLGRLRDEANAWLLAQHCDRALDPLAVAYFRSRFCLPAWLVDVIRREEEKDT